MGVRALVLGVALLCAAAAQAAPCRLRGAPLVESAAGARSLDLRSGEEARVFVAVPVWLGGRAVLLSDSGLAGRLPFSACPDARLTWQRIEPLLEHTHTPSPNPDVAVFANAVVFGPRHGSWIGYDRIETLSTPLAEQGSSLRLVDARPSTAIGAPDRGARANLGVMRVAATVTIDGQSRTSPTELERAFRYTVRDGDGFVGWLFTFFNVPYLFGSAGKGARAQAEQYYGADCADVLVAALRRTGLRIEYTSVSGLVDRLRRVAGPVAVQPCAPDLEAPCGATSLRWGKDVLPGDLLALDYIDSTALPRPWDHIVAALEDRGPGDAPDGLLGPEDLVADTGDRAGLKLTALAHQGHVRVMVLRPPTPPKPASRD